MILKLHCKHQLSIGAMIISIAGAASQKGRDVKMSINIEISTHVRICAMRQFVCYLFGLF